jgi:hypothetical protein
MLPGPGPGSGRRLRAARRPHRVRVLRRAVRRPRPQSGRIAGCSAEGMDRRATGAAGLRPVPASRSFWPNRPHSEIAPERLREDDPARPSRLAVFPWAISDPPTTSSARFFRSAHIFDRTRKSREAVLLDRQGRRHGSRPESVRRSPGGAAVKQPSRSVVAAVDRRTARVS